MDKYRSDEDHTWKELMQMYDKSFFGEEKYSTKLSDNCSYEKFLSVKEEMTKELYEHSFREAMTHCEVLDGILRDL